MFISTEEARFDSIAGSEIEFCLHKNDILRLERDGAGASTWILTGTTAEGDVGAFKNIDEDEWVEVRRVVVDSREGNGCQVEYWQRYRL